MKIDPDIENFIFSNSRPHDSYYYTLEYANKNNTNRHDNMGCLSQHMDMPTHTA